MLLTKGIGKVIKNLRALLDNLVVTLIDVQLWDLTRDHPRADLVLVQVLLFVKSNLDNELLADSFVWR